MQAAEAAVSRAIGRALGPEYADADPVVRPSQFADIQVNAALALAGRRKSAPREVAAQIAAELTDGPDAAAFSAVEISGPGFLNITFARESLEAALVALAGDPRLGVPVEEPQTIPIDYSAPNVAKEMHVGHLRTTVVGDSLARTLEHLGHHVIRQNHIGDWGTPFGMLIEHLIDVGVDSEDAAALETDPNAFYQAARTRFEGDEGFATRSRARVVALQSGDPDTLAVWDRLVGLSRQYFNRIYTTLGVTLTDADLAGESTYNDDLAGVCAELEERGIARVSEGALCVFLDGYTGRDGQPLPLIIRKSDGGYGYATTDLATVRHRVADLGADRILYVVGAPQALHFEMVWATARLAGWLPEDVEVVHVKIGNVLGADRKILRTRSGSPLRLVSLLEEAIATARAVIDESRPDLPEALREQIAPQVGIGAVKYADLSVAHDSEYVFDLERMTALQGNTGPYLQYAVARIRSILRRAQETDDAGEPSGGSVGAGAAVQLAEPAERALALQLLEFGPVVAGVGASLEPHKLAGYLFDLAQQFSGFYEQCPVVRAEDASVRASRLVLCRLSVAVLAQGLELLGIEAPDQM